MGQWYNPLVHFLWLTCLNISHIELYAHSKGCCKLLFPTKSLPYLSMPIPDLLSSLQGPTVTATVPFWPPLFQLRQVPSSTAFLKGLPVCPILSSPSQNSYDNSVLSVAASDVPYQILAINHFPVPI